MLSRLFAQDPPAATILQLLQHVSGASDYYEGLVARGVPFHRQFLADFDQEWPPAKVLDFVRTRQRPIGRLGERFIYSDTSFDVLGMLIEAIESKPYHSAITDRIIISTRRHGENS